MEVCGLAIPTRTSVILTQDGGPVKRVLDNLTTGPCVLCTTQHLGVCQRKAVMIHMAMVRDEMFGKTMRKSYAKYKEILEIPNMLKIQKDSYQWFLDEGLREVFRDVGTITDFSGKLELTFLDYTMEDRPK